MRGGTDIVGYIASGLVLLTFTTKEMRSLRIMAILSNLAFIAYGLLDEILPVLALHVILFPLNVYRLAQLEIAKAPVQEAPHREAQPVRRSRGRSRGTVTALASVSSRTNGTCGLSLVWPGRSRYVGPLDQQAKRP
jgi:hypothetical protein